MYNDRMPVLFHEIRVCESCGLRYPLVESHPFGTRCPACMGETRVATSRQLSNEIAQNQPRKAQFATDEGGKRLAVVLDNIRSAWNVGSILRSADGFGFTHAYLCGITPSGDDDGVRKTSLGAEVSVPWSQHKDAVRLVAALKAEGWMIYGLEENERAVPLTRMRTAGNREGGWHQNEVILLGNEVSGVDPGLLDLCDEVLYIPMRGEKRSFNVAIAFGIAAYELTR